MPDPEIRVWRQGIWRPWRWECRSLWGIIDGRAWTREQAYAHARICQALRAAGRRGL